jgi:putative FmdB family regulatory protein
MPIYEFVCEACGARFRRLVGVVSNPAALRCPRCLSEQLNRQISRFARVRSEDEALDSMADEMEAMGDPDDPASVRRMMRSMGSEMGEDMEGEFDRMMEEPGAEEGYDEPDD